MWIQNIKHLGKYEISKDGWEALGPRQKLFKVIDGADEQKVDNTVNSDKPAKIDLNKNEKNKSTPGQENGKKTNQTKS